LVVAALAVATPATAVKADPPPTFVAYVTPSNLSQSAGEPSIGNDWSTGTTLFEAVAHTFAVTFDDTKTPATATWVDRSAPSSVTSLDPILFVDHNTNRAIVSQLVVGCSLSSVSDNDGVTWVPDQGCGVHGAEDHQTVGGGPFAPPLTSPPAPAYQDAVYYCSQDFANGTAAFCSLSVDGGLTYGQPSVIYNFQTCGGLHGHIRVAPDGTAYVPNQGCFTDTTISDPKGDQFSKQSVVVSSDNGASWTVLPVPDSRATFYSDPSVAVGAGNSVYFGYENGGTDGQGHTVPSAGGGHPMIAVSHDHGKNWSPSVDVGTAFGIKNTAFPEVIAGDDNRAAFAFLGSTTGGDYQPATFAGTWHLYISMTYDGGATWSTIDATPNDPVQRGCIWLQGGSNTCRNLLDFNDITVDKQGRVLVAYADGCTGACVTDPTKNAHTSVGTIARQASGMGLFATPPSNVPEARAPLALVAVGGGAAALLGGFRRRRRTGDS
jgi:hypothetical protein